MVVKGIRVPVGFPGEQRNISLIDGSASIALLIWSNNKDQNFQCTEKVS